MREYYYNYPTILAFALRYAMGRMSAAPWVVDQAIRASVQDNQLSREWLLQHADEIAAEMHVETTCRGHLGMSCDVASWRETESFMRTAAETAPTHEELFARNAKSPNIKPRNKA